MIALITYGPSSAARLTEISRALTYARSLDEVLELTVQCASQLLDARKVVLMLSGPDGLLYIRASWGVERALCDQFREPLDEHLITRLERVLGPDVQDYFLGVPLVTRGEVIGLLAVRRAEPVRSDEAGERLLSALADQAAVAIEGAQERERRDHLEVRVGDLERQHTSQDEAIRFLSHDIRTALGSIDGYAALMAGGVMGEISERQKEVLDRIRQVGTHLLSLLGNATEIARLRTEGITFRSTALFLEDVVADAVNVVIPVARKAGIQINVQHAPRVEVVTDRHRLRQVLVQLLDNAIKYSPEGSTVTVSARAVTDDDRDWGEVKVEDQGPGIAPENLETIFRPYERVGRAAPESRVVSGLGLGLAIAKDLVQRMGGSISVESEVGKGSSFAVRMPLSRARSGGSDKHD
jgi:signal transduction histidine kinase